MAVPTGTLQTHQAIGNREDLEDIIWDISPTKYPFTTRVKKGKASAVFHEWQTDALDAAGTNAQIEGDDVATNTATPTVRLRNYCQIIAKVARVSDTQNLVDKAGRDDEMAYQVRKRMEECRRDLEYACTRNQESTAGAAASARKMAGIESWLATNKTSAGTGTAQTTPGYSGGTVAAPTDSTAAGTLTESHLKAVIQETWTQGGDPRLLLVGPATKSKISTAFAGIATRYRTVGAGKQADIVAGADLYVSDFGEHTIVPSHFMRDRNILALDMEYWELAQLSGMKKKDLAKTGMSERKLIVWEGTLVSRNQAASGKVTDINPAL